MLDPRLEVTLLVCRQVMAMAAQGSNIWSASGADVYYSPSSFGWVSGYPSDYCGFAKTRVVPYVKGRFLSINPNLLRKMVTRYK